MSIREVIKEILRMCREDLCKPANRDLTLRIGGVPIKWDRRGYLVIPSQRLEGGMRK